MMRPILEPSIAILRRGHGITPDSSLACIRSTSMASKLGNGNMRVLVLATGLGLAALWILSGGQGFAQQPSADQAQNPQASTGSQPQKKDAGKGDAASSSKSTSHSTAADNPFPEAESRAAAKDSGKDSEDAPANPQPDSKQHSTAADNPFPEDVSRKAAKAADDASEPSPAKLPPGVSSSQSSGLSGDLAGQDGSSTVTDPARAKKDAQVGSFYLTQGNSQGAYLRYQDAIKYDPTNIDAIFGAAEAARQLGKFPEAARDYQLYLEISPNGPKSKKALKALSALPGEK